MMMQSSFLFPFSLVSTLIFIFNKFCNRVQSHLKFSKVQNCFKLCQKLTYYPAYQISIIRENFTGAFLKYKRLKLKLRVFLAGHSAAMVTYCVKKIIPTYSPVIGQFFDTMIVASIDK